MNLRTTAMRRLKKQLLIHKYFPEHSQNLAFGEILTTLFFSPRPDNKDFPIHGPNVIRFVEALVEGEPTAEPGLIKAPDDEQRNEARNAYINAYPKIMQAVEVDLGSATASDDKRGVTELLKIAALYHDIGKFVRRANHPQIGSNLLRNFSEQQRRLLVDSLIFESESSHASLRGKHNRFSLIASIVQHHDKFGVACTGEGALPLFSDVLYFTSDETTISGIKKNITSVMLMNLADIAAVNVGSSEDRQRSLKLANAVGNLRSGAAVEREFEGKTEEVLLQELVMICQKPECCLGIGPRKINQVLNDWTILMEAIEHQNVRGNRVRMKSRLLDVERNPARAIQRILRLLEESASTTGCEFLLDFLTPTAVESILVGTLGAHQFQSFCEQLATVAKLDYGLRFFQAITCACARKRIYKNYNLEMNVSKELNANRLTPHESAQLGERKISETSSISDLAAEVATLFARVLASLVSRYEGVLDSHSASPRRFGFQMRDLTEDVKIRDTIIGQLCLQDHKDPIALTWIVDEVTIWSMD